MSEPTTIAEYFASRGLSDPERRADLGERLEDADGAAVDALGAYKDALAAQLEDRPRGASGSLDLDEVADRASTALRELDAMHREVRGFLADAKLEIPVEWVREFRAVLLLALWEEGEKLADLEYIELDKPYGAPGKRRPAVDAYRRMTGQLGPLAELIGFEDRESERPVSVPLAVHDQAVRQVLRAEAQRLADRTEESPKEEAWVRWITGVADAILSPAELATARGEGA